MGGDVAAVQDLSGKGRHLAVGAGANPPYFVEQALNGQPGIEFIAGSSNLLEIDALALSTFTIFTVFRATTTNGLVYEHAYGTASNSYLFTTNSATIATSRSSLTTARAWNASWGIDGTNRIVRHEYDGTHAGHQMCVNGTRLVLPTFGGLSADPGTATTPPLLFTVGGRTGPTLPFNGHLMELIICSPKLSEADAQRLERSYLGPRYGLPVA